MSEVHAIKDLNTISLISHLLQLRYGQQYADIWQVGINVALRISDLLSVKFSDIENNCICICESKTRKHAQIPLNTKALSVITRRKQEHPEHIYLFQSHRSPIAKSSTPMPLSRRAVTIAFQGVGKELNLKLGTHSMRKTRGYMLYKSTNDIARVMQMLRHSSVGTTLRYIGITQELVNQDFKSLEL